MNKIYLTLIILLTTYLLVFSFLYLFQRSLLYHPTENNYYGDLLKVSIKK